MQNKIGIEEFISSLSRSILRKNILDEIGITLSQSRKLSDAGIYLTGSEDIEINFDMEKIMNDIGDLRRSIEINVEYNFQGTDIMLLINALSDESTLCSPPKQQNSISGSSIAERNYASSHF